jgi:hypothetical protein
MPQVPTGGVQPESVSQAASQRPTFGFVLNHFAGAIGKRLTDADLDGAYTATYESSLCTDPIVWSPSNPSSSLNDPSLP